MGVYLWTDTAYIPTANTLAYYPLNSTTTVNDKSWNSKNMTLSWTVTFGDYNWIDCAYFNGGYLYLNESLVLGANPRTISCWYYRTNSAWQWGAFWGMWTASANNWIAAYIGTNSWDYEKISYWNRSWDTTSGVTVTNNSWHLLTVTYNWNTINEYNDSTLISTKSSVTLNLTNTRTALAQFPNFWANQYKGYFSEFIFENKKREATEISNYYNSTKSTYWL